MLDDVATLQPCITIRGDVASRGGSYLLRIAVLEAVKVQFGRFLAGELVAVPAGDYLLNETAVSLQHIYIFRSFQRLKSLFATALPNWLLALQQEKEANV